MNKLRAILYGTYVILILVLLMMNMGLCCPEPEPTPPPAAPTLTEPPVAQEPERTPPSAQDQEALRRAQRIGGSGALKITLLWDFSSDIDLHVTQPNGKTIFYRNTRDAATGGFLDVDNRTGGRNSAENIYWSNPPAGNYIVKLNYYARRNNSSGLCTVVVNQQGQDPKFYRVNMSQVGETKNIAVVTINR